MNRNLLILGIAGILLLLALLNILRRDNNNTGPHAVYGPKGTDDLPEDMFKELAKKGYGQLKKGYYKIAGTPEERMAKNIYYNHPHPKNYKNSQEWVNTHSKDNYKSLLNNIIGCNAESNCGRELSEGHNMLGEKLKDMNLELISLEIQKLAKIYEVDQLKKQSEEVEGFRNLNDFANDNLDILKGNKCYEGCCPGTYSCDAGCVCMTSAQREFIGNRRGGNRTQYDHNNDF